MFSVYELLDDPDPVSLHCPTNVDDGRVEAVQHGTDQYGHTRTLKYIFKHIKTGMYNIRRFETGPQVLKRPELFFLGIEALME